MVFMDLFVVGESGRLSTRVLASVRVHALKRAVLSKIFQIVRASGALSVGGGSGISISLAAKLVEKLWRDQKLENADRGDSHGLPKHRVGRLLKKEVAKLERGQ